jgi:alkylation response protein AidB-like acyl-CoA dehydrogenase
MDGGFTVVGFFVCKKKDFPMAKHGLDNETLNLTVDAIRQFTQGELPDDKLLELDEKDEFPIDLIRDMCGNLGIQLLFIPEEYGGMGGGAWDVYRVCEELGRVDLGVATGVLATFLGADPIVWGATDEQKELWLTKIGEENLLMAYGATEPEAGSDLGAIRTTATPVEEGGKVTGYKINGNKMWISNGGYADLYTILAAAPGGPSWFVVEKGTGGLEAGKPEDKHGIRASNTAALSLENVYVDADRLLGLEEGQGLIQAQLVFGYTRLMVAAFGLGGGWAAMDRAIPYSTTRIAAGTPLSEKTGYTHKLIVPGVVNLEAARAYVEETAERIDDGEGALNTEGAIAKYMATEAGCRAAEASIQALGGYGYSREYMVEKIKRDVRITTIYEGTSEIMEMTICRDRWQLHLKTRGQYYGDRARAMEALHAEFGNVGADTAALALDALAAALERARVQRLTRNQHILFRLGEMIAWAETAECMARKAGMAAQGQLSGKAVTRFDAQGMAAIARIFAREAAVKVGQESTRWLCGASGTTAADTADFVQKLNLAAIHNAQAGNLDDMDLLADVVYERVL